MKHRLSRRYDGTLVTVKPAGEMLRRPASRARADHAHRRRMGFPGARAFRPKGRRSGVNNGNRSRKSPACRAAGAVLAGASRARGLAPLTEIDRFRIVLAIDVSLDRKSTRLNSSH